MHACMHACMHVCTCISICSLSFVFAQHTPAINTQGFEDVDDICFLVQPVSNMPAVNKHKSH